ncbi:Retrovirus-related Pol poly from transposon 412 [Paramuricea clavata]|uniref:Retrovirus-related Pol poly from transposon 412, partial n=1 Tax=Paramuricea clavata TaxID=317549 RepID=A0A7D9LZS8_PARCT|nr:Retrovirus-related Pol poly from transposon 412 [Paramuricea clavata]
MQRLHTDQGRNFESAVFKEIIDILGIKKTRTTPYHPQSDGLVERMNRTLKDILSKLVNERQDDWDRCLPQALLAYRSTVQTSTGFSPHFLVFGRETRIPVDLMTPEPPQAEVPPTTSEYAEKLRKRFERTYELTRVNTKKSSERYKDYYDAKAKDTTYNVGEKVWLYVPFVKKGKNLKLSRPWRGPYTIVKKISDVVYRIEKNANKRNRLVVHYNRLKPCFERPLKSLPNRPPNETKLQSKETTETRKENVENCSGQTPQTEPPTNGGNDEDEWTVRYFRRNLRQSRPSRAINGEEHGQNLPDEVQEDVQHLPDELQQDGPLTRHCENQ